MSPRPCSAHGARRGQRGFTLITVLIAIFLFGFGLLAVMRSLGSVTGGATQNQNVATTASLSNAFWGVVQANPTLVTNSAFQNTYTTANISSAPSALQPWLYSLTDTGKATATGLPGASAKVETFADAAGIGSTCTVASGCTVKLTLQWSQPGSATVTTRTQIFYYQFGL